MPLDGSDAAYHALEAACTAAGRGAQISCLHVIEVPRSLPLDATVMTAVDRGERILARAEEIAKRHHVTLRAELLQARQAGHAVVDEAIERAVDAIVVGVEYHRPYGRFELGRLPLYVLAYAPCEVWLIRHRPEAVEGPLEPELEAGHLLPRRRGRAEPAGPADDRPPAP